MKVSALQTDFIFSPIPDVDEGEEEEEEEGMGPCLPVTPKNCLSPRGISVLEKLVKTCPVWLQLGLDRVEAARILNREVTGTFLVRQDSCSKHLVLCVHFPALVGSSSKVLEYTIKEEKSSPAVGAERYTCAWEQKPSRAHWGPLCRWTLTVITTGMGDL
uniref:Ras and Rab interactor 3 n=1 Tax=Molossus molossus TaxID=27622 RepID=A0A7J8K0P9_MOLMO|nr:Ras and Rab interactor 3 [Molossus molossus]